MNFVNNHQLGESNELVKEKTTNNIIFEINEQLKHILERLDVIEQYLQIGDYSGH
jgi:hypothetical protein